jgi:hypothetical protein
MRVVLARSAILLNRAQVSMPGRLCDYVHRMNASPSELFERECTCDRRGL